MGDSMTVVEFEVERSPFPYINKLMRAACLCDSVVINGIESICETYSVTWKDGEVVDEARKQLVKDKIKQGLEELGYDCYSVLEIKTIRNPDNIGGCR